MDIVDCAFKVRDCVGIIQKVIELVSIAKQNDILCRDILGQMEVIESILEDLQEMTQSSTVMKAVDILHKKMVNCENYIDVMRDLSD